MVRGSGFAVRTKADGTPVTDVDEAVEDALREVLARERPGDAVLGEERGLTGDGPRRWIIDAIDGTANLAAGSPFWGTLIALEEEDRLRIGLLSAPMFDRRWWAEVGAGAWRTRDPAGWPASAGRLAVSARASIAEARAAVLPDSDGVLPAEVVGAVGRSCELVEVAGHPALLVAQGELEISVHLGGGPWDHAALAVIVAEAGGDYSDLRGNRRVDAGSMVFTNGCLHSAALALLGPGA